MHRRAPLLGLLVLVAASPTFAQPVDSVVKSAPERADDTTWVSFDMPAVITDGAVGYGAAISVMRDNGHGGIGLRARGGNMNNGLQGTQQAFGSIGIALRRDIGHGFWFEVGGGGGEARKLVGLEVESGVGFDFHVAGVPASLSARYVRMDLGISKDHETQMMALAGFGFYLGRDDDRGESVRAAASHPMVATTAVRPAFRPGAW